MYFPSENIDGERPSCEKRSSKVAGRAGGLGSGRKRGSVSRRGWLGAEPVYFVFAYQQHFLNNASS